MVLLERLPNRDLKIILEDKEELEDIMENPSIVLEDHILAEILDRAGYIGNGWEIPAFIGLTEAPALGYGAMYDDIDDIEPSNYEELWWFPNYMVESFAETLRDAGEVVFRHAIEYNEANAICLECGATLEDSSEDICENGHDAWIEVGDQYRVPEIWEEATKKFNLTSEELISAIRENKKLIV
jgi:hypothetical protein